ncbi:Hydroxycinnamoyl CoA shikimate/quinate hydroxycinnamoyltransferase [Theobroma cacao]|uniref:Hydroxycinnamoyl CoA shikimate/quinate hydroxycinnamoyltransferase n=1 Tax=Theobroma cacao TaxID=3641 RepID=A0A061ETU9_THECC|nr:Hydroxycinnamoyl CoA shikimate/quinate hydroxycinnamoyltransferase [Theobroma cacao]
MEIAVKESTMVCPAEETPNRRLWVSNLDLVMTIYHVPTVYFYRPNGSSDFFDTKVLKESLGKILVPFYPIAGRLGYDENGRLEIICNAKGVLFIEAETTSIMDDLVQDFTDGSKVPQLAPKIDYSGGISSYPLLGLQVITFKCGGISLGVSCQHTLVDGSSGLHFINSRANTVRGLSPSIAPCLDLFRITADQLNTLKAKVNENSNSNTKYSTYSILTAHIWRCATKARDLLEDQQLKLNMPIDGRNRLHPSLPPGYFGNVISMAALFTLAGDLLSESFIDTVKRIHKILKEMHNEYLRSAIDYIEIAPDIEAIRRGPQTFRCPNLLINSWKWLPIHDSDFGWGCPIFMRPANIVHEGKVCMLPSPTKDGSLTLVTRLETSHMKLFGKLLYEF